MGILTRVDPRLRKGLSAVVVRLLTGEPEPEAQVHEAKKVVVEAAHYHKAAKLQVTRRLRSNVKKRKAKRRG